MASSSLVGFTLLVGVSLGDLPIRRQTIENTISQDVASSFTEEADIQSERSSSSVAASEPSSPGSSEDDYQSVSDSQQWESSSSVPLHNEYLIFEQTPLFADFPQDPLLNSLEIYYPQDYGYSDPFAPIPTDSFDCGSLNSMLSQHGPGQCDCCHSIPNMSSEYFDDHESNVRSQSLPAPVLSAAPAESRSSPKRSSSVSSGRNRSRKHKIQRIRAPTLFDIRQRASEANSSSETSPYTRDIPSFLPSQ
jgi:hypothetical protein